jgi:hypothetical protein
MDWARILAYVTGTVDQELLARNEYLAIENRILKDQLKGRLLLSNAERATLGEIGHRLGRKVLAEVAAVARPDTILPGTASWSPVGAHGARSGDLLRAVFHPVWSKNPSDRLFMRPLDDNNAAIARGIGRTALDRGHGSQEIAGRCSFLGGCAPHGSGQRIHSGPAVANAHQGG